jgi:hypothetical protein
MLMWAPLVSRQISRRYSISCGLPWCHDKYPDVIRFRNTLAEACLVLQWPQRPLYGLPGVEGRDLKLVDNVLHITPQEKIH